MLIIQPARTGSSVRVEHAETGGGMICFLAGNLEHHTVDQFRQDLPPLVDEPGVIFDVSAVPFIDSAGIGALIGAVRRVRDEGGRAAVCGARPSVSRVFELVGLSRVVRVCKSADEAKEYFLGSNG
jgi:anti-anti-sigma factor